MPRVTRKRTISAEPGEVWGLISDPYSLARWWPKVMRVESVEGEGAEAQWTKVLGTAEGRGVRADFRCSDLVEGERYAWKQQIPGTPFERHLRSYAIAITLTDETGGTGVSIAAHQTLRGLSRLGSPMMRRGQGALLDEALDGLERTLT